MGGIESPAARSERKGHNCTLCTFRSLLGAGTVFLLSMAPAGAAVSVRDDLGRTVTLTKPAARVVALAPNVVELLYAAGAGGSLVGTVSDADYPPAVKTVRKVGSYSNPDEEALVAVKPDLVVMTFGNPKALISRLEARRVPVFITHAKRVGDVIAAIRSLGTLTGHAPQAARAAGSLQKRLSALAARLKGRPPVKSLLMVWDDPVTVVGAGAYLNDALRLAGGANAAGDLAAPYPTLDAEQVAVRNPDAILYAGHDPASRVKLAPARPGLRTTTAARTGRIVAVPENLVIRAGPRLVDGIEAMARALHPEAWGR
jgi:iron complex transport system substrate-binding protein